MRIVPATELDLPMILDLIQGLGSTKNSTFLAQPGLYLEDLFVRPHLRGKAIGLALLKNRARIATERGCGRLEWAVLDWNQPAIGFYKKLGAVALDEWTKYRLSDEALERLAGFPG